MFGSRRYEALLRASEKRFAELNSESAERFDALHRESEQRYGDELQVTRQFMRRNELAFKEAFRVLADLVEESRAQRKALLKILDRLENGGEAAAS